MTRTSLPTAVRRRPWPWRWSARRRGRPGGRRLRALGLDARRPTPAPSATRPARRAPRPRLQTKTAGTLTIATDEPVYEPWFVDDKPTNKKGFESAVAYAVATKLGYADSQVNWVRAHFDDVISPTPKKFDFDINEFSITDARAKVVDFSTGYYDVTQAVVTVKGSKIAGATTIAALQGAKLGAQKGTTSYDAIGSVIKPSQAAGGLQHQRPRGAGAEEPPDRRARRRPADRALRRGRPGQGRHRRRAVRPRPVRRSSSASCWARAARSPSCVSQAVDALRADGTLKQLATQWLTGTSGAPVLQ